MCYRNLFFQGASKFACALFHEPPKHSTKIFRRRVNFLLATRGVAGVAMYTYIDKHSSIHGDATSTKTSSPEGPEFPLPRLCSFRRGAFSSSGRGSNQRHVCRIEKLATRHSPFYSNSLTCLIFHSQDIIWKFNLSSIINDSNF